MNPSATWSRLASAIICPAIPVEYFFHKSITVEIALLTLMLLAVGDGVIVRGKASASGFDGNEVDPEATLASSRLRTNHFLVRLLSVSTPNDSVSSLPFRTSNPSLSTLAICDTTAASDLFGGCENVGITGDKLNSLCSAVAESGCFHRRWLG